MAILPLGFTVLFWFCSEKEALQISGYSPSQPGSIPTIDRTDLKTSSGSYLPGYESGKILSDRITLEWQQNGDGDFLSYRVIRNNGIIKIIKDRTTTAYTDSNLFQNTSLNYKIAVINQRGMAQTDTIRLKTPRFFAPSGLTATVSQNDVSLNWINRAEPEISFRIHRRLDFGIFQATATTNDTTYTDTGLPSGTYTYQVTAFFNSLEETAPSNTTTVVIP
jgi:hypothetical protein